MSDNIISGCKASVACFRLWNIPSMAGKWHVQVGLHHGNYSRYDGIDSGRCDTAFTYSAVVDDFGNLVRVPS